VGIKIFRSRWESCTAKGKLATSDVLVIDNKDTTLQNHPPHATPDMGRRLVFSSSLF